MIRIISILFASLVLSFLISYSLVKYVFKTPPVNTETQSHVLPTLFPTIGVQGSPSPTNVMKSIKQIIPSKIPTPTTYLSPTVTSVPTRAVGSQIKVMPLGDSITDGGVVLGGYRVELWNKLVAQDGDNLFFVGSMYNGAGDIAHEGHIGWEIGQIDGSVGTWVSNYQPDIILLHIGTNDLDHGATAEVMAQRLSSLIGHIFAAKPNTYVIVSSIIVSTHGEKGTWVGYNSSIPGIVAQYRGQGRKIIQLDMSQTLTEGDLADGLHPTATGYSKMANAWYPVVSTIYRELSGKSQ